MAQIERIPPHNDEAEKSVLGSILIDQDAFMKVFDVVKAEDFYSPAHKEIFNAALDLYRENEPIDIITVTESLKKRKALEAAGGRAYLAQLSNEVPTSANAVQYAKIIAEKAIGRKIISAAATMVDNAYSDALDNASVLDKAESAIFDIAKGKEDRSYEGIQPILERTVQKIQAVRQSGEILTGVTTGFKDLDDTLAGLQRSDLIILAARPSMGKTALALNIAQNAAFKGKARVVVFSLEMSKEQLASRMIAMESRVDSKKLRKATLLTPEDCDKIGEAVKKFDKADIIIEDTPGIGVMEIRNKCRRISQERPIDLVIIDYMQQMSADDKGDSREQEISKISRYLKQLARELDCPIVALSQLSRAVESVQRKDKRPILSDLRESGAIEQDADVVIFLYRDDYYHRDQPPTNVCEVIIAKQRMGETKTVKLSWMPSFTKFGDYIDEQAVAQYQNS